MTSEVVSGDRAGLVVRLVGRLVATGDEWEPYRLVDPGGAAVGAVSEWLADLQAAGRQAATLRSYGLDLLRWFRFLWAVAVPWERATATEARDFARWMQMAGKPVRPHWRHPEEDSVVSSGGVYAASVRAHSETVLRSFYDFHRDAGS